MEGGRWEGRRRGLGAQNATSLAEAAQPRDSSRASRVIDSGARSSRL